MFKNIVIFGISCFMSISCTDKTSEPDERTQTPGTDVVKMINDSTTLSKAKEIANRYIVIDTHIDVPERLESNYEDISNATENGDFDYPRAIKGGLNAPFMSIYIPARYEKNGGGKALANKLIDDIEKIVQSSPDKFALAYSTEDIQYNFKTGKMSLPMGMENGTPIEGNLENLKYFYDRGIRYITLAHSRSNHISDSSYDKNRQWNGLSDFGKELVIAMNHIGMMVDVSHVSDEAFYQVLEISKAPVIASHSSARHFTPNFERNMSDKMIKTLAAKGGVIQINFGSSFLIAEANAWYDDLRDSRDAYMVEHSLEYGSKEVNEFSKNYREKNLFPYASIGDVVAHIDHVKDLVGIDHIGIGSDFDGVGDSLPIGLKDVSAYPNLISALLDKGYTEKDIVKILSGNILRVWKQVEDFASNSTEY